MDNELSEIYIRFTKEKKLGLGKEEPYLDPATLEAKQDIDLDLRENLRYRNAALEPDVLSQVVDMVISTLLYYYYLPVTSFKKN